MTGEYSKWKSSIERPKFRRSIVRTSRYVQIEYTGVHTPYGIIMSAEKMKINWYRYNLCFLFFYYKEKAESIFRLILKKRANALVYSCAGIIA